MHLSYCHEIAKKFGPITLVTLNPKLSEVLVDDPNFKEIIYIEKFHKKITDIIQLSIFLKNLDLKNFFIFYPSLRYVISSKIAGIKNVYHYPFFKKKNLHLVKAAKKFTEQSLNILNCPTETLLYIDPVKKINLKNKISNIKKKIILGVGSSGPTTRWGAENFISLIKKININKDHFFYLLCGPNEKEIADKILNEIGNECCSSLDNKNSLNEDFSLINLFSSILPNKVLDFIPS